MIDTSKIQEYTDVYLKSYMRAMERTRNPDLATQTAMGVTMALIIANEPNKSKLKPDPQQFNPVDAFFAAILQGAANQGHQESNPQSSEEIESNDDK